MAQQPRRGKDHPDVKVMREHHEARAKATAEAMRRMESSQPTPTQDENDLAKIGIGIDEKEDDRSGETVITRTVVAGQPLGPHGYETRAVKRETKKESSQI